MCKKKNRACPPDRASVVVVVVVVVRVVVVVVVVIVVTVVVAVAVAVGVWLGNEFGFRRPEPTQRRHTAEILGGRWVRCFQLRKEVSSLFVHYWDWLHSRGSVSHGRGVLVCAICR